MEAQGIWGDPSSTDSGGFVSYGKQNPVRPSSSAPYSQQLVQVHVHCRLARGVLQTYRLLLAFYPQR